MHMSNKDKTGTDMNRDPITGAPGAHPVGVGVGATGGALAGAAVGAVGGPVGSAVGAIVGGVAGGLAGKAAGEAVNPTAEDSYWRDTYAKEPYYQSNYTYDDYAPAYRTGYEGATKYQGKRFDEVDTELERDYEAIKGQSKLAWNDARQATRSAWHRVENALPGDADNDGR
jgi:phage tail tape-measure protein